MLPLVFFG